MRLQDFFFGDVEKPPRHCPACDNDLSEFPYYQLHPGPVARKLLGLAWVLLPIMTALFLYQLLGEEVPGWLPRLPRSFSAVSGYFILAYVCAPSLLVYSISILLPKRRRVICQRCSWYREYSYRPGMFGAG